MGTLFYTTLRCKKLYWIEPRSEHLVFIWLCFINNILSYDFVKGLANLRNPRCTATSHSEEGGSSETTHQQPPHDETSTLPTPLAAVYKQKNFWL
jgi:hypothetical protein